MQGSPKKLKTYSGRALEVLSSFFCIPKDIQKYILKNFLRKPDKKLFMIALGIYVPLKHKEIEPIALSGNLDLFHWCRNKYKWAVDIRTFDNALLCNNLSVVRWISLREWKSNLYRHPMFITFKSVSLETFKWYMENIPRSEADLDHIYLTLLNYKRKDAFNYIIQHHVLSDFVKEQIVLNDITWAL